VTAVTVRETGIEVHGIAFAEHRVVAVDVDDNLASDDVDDFRALMLVRLRRLFLRSNAAACCSRRCSRLSPCRQVLRRGFPAGCRYDPGRSARRVRTAWP
jgi:hypothetical protein